MGTFYTFSFGSYTKRHHKKNIFIYTYIYFTNRSNHFIKFYFIFLNEQNEMVFLFDPRIRSSLTQLVKLNWLILGERLVMMVGPMVYANWTLPDGWMNSIMLNQMWHKMFFFFISGFTIVYNVTSFLWWSHGKPCVN